MDELWVDGRDVPYVAPHYDVRRAQVITLFSNPDPRAGWKRGAGIVSFCNDDPSAQRMLATASSSGTAARQGPVVRG